DWSSDVCSADLIMHVRWNRYAPVPEPDPQSWRDDAVCHNDPNPELWFADHEQDTSQAKALCSWCPVRDECLNFALERGEKWGVWGGMTTDERNRLLKERRRA